MRTFTRKLSYVEVMDLVQVINLAINLPESLTGAEKLVLGKLQKKLGERLFKKNSEDFDERRELALEKGEQKIDWTDDDKAKKEVELKHVELSAIANAMLSVLNNTKSNQSQVQMIVKLIDGDCLMLDRHIENNIKVDKIQLVEVPEDRDLIPEEAEIEEVEE